MILDDLDRHARERPGERAVVEVRADGSVHELTWGALENESARVASTLLRLAVLEGEPVAFQLPNRLEFVTIALGTLRAGAVCEPLMPMFRERELEFMLRESGARVLFVPDTFRGRDHATMATALRETLPNLEHVVVLPDGYQSVLGQTPDGVFPAQSPDQIAQLLFTSGTSGEPKGALHRQDVLTRAADHHIEHFGLGADDVIYIPSPLAHQTGFLYGMWIAIRLGVPQLVQEVWDAEVGLDAMRRFGATFVQAATPFLADLTRVAEVRGEGWVGTQSLKTFVATGAAIPRELARRSREILGAEVGGAWGTTESCLGCAFAPGDPPELAWGTDGRALTGVQLRVVDDDGQTLGTGEEGNFEVHTDCLFDGYLNRPELTAEAVTADGWYRTGDLARIDAHGYVRITGRVKDVINRGGEKVPVAEIEQLLHAHPAVLRRRDRGHARRAPRRAGLRVRRRRPRLRDDARLSRLSSRRQDLLARASGAGRVSPPDALGQDPEVRPASSRPRTSHHMTTAPTTDFEALRVDVRRYVEDEGERWAELIEREHQVPLELWEELRERGYLRLAAPPEYGGAGIPFTRYLELLELFSMSHASLRMIVHVANGIWRPMDSHANDDQRERFIKPTVAGEIKVAFTLTEPGAGSGADIRCSVVREDDTYYLSGEKHLITFGTIADYLMTFARVEGTRGTEGTVALMVPTRGEGVDAREMPETMGVRGTDHGHIVFDRAPVPVADRFGEEGQGVEIALSGFLGPSRISLATTCVGLAQRALDLALDYARQRETFGKKIAERQAIAFRLAEMATDLEAARRLVRHAATTWVQTGSAPMEAAMAKLFASEMLQRVTDGALQVHGGIGYWSSSPIERVYRDARAQRFEEGTAEIQKTTIARDLLRR